MLNLFHRSCYVGYTATPFANIFIDPDQDDEMYNEDLFPKDFIIGLDAPKNYFGPKKIFYELLDKGINDSISNKIIANEEDWESVAIKIFNKKFKDVPSRDIKTNNKQKAFIQNREFSIKEI